MRIDTNGLPKFGSMTSGGGLAGIFDDLGHATVGYAQATSGFAGVDFTSNPQAIDKVVLTSAGNGWDASGASGGQIRFRLYGKKGAAPTGQYDGVLLGMAGPIRDINAVIDHAVYSYDWFTKWDYVWVMLETPVWSILSSFKIFAPVIPSIGADRSVLRRRSDSSQPIAKAGSQIPGMRFLFELTQPAAVIPIIKIEFEHQAWATGIGSILSAGAYLQHRAADTLEGLASAPWRELDVSGRNLSTDTHYERHEPRDACNLAAGFHEIGIQINTNTYESSADWYSGVLVEYGRGLNKGIVIIDPGAVVIDL